MNKWGRIKVKQESAKEKQEQARMEWIKNNFESIDDFVKQVFELRQEKSQIIRSKLKIPDHLWGARRIRKLREDAIKYMTKRELKKNPNITSDELWKRWKLRRIPTWTKKNRVRMIRGYDGIFEEAKKELAHI